MFEKVYSLKLGKIAVVPLAGTWIEITWTGHPSRASASFPSRERGLKYPLKRDHHPGLPVVPLAGTWIEIDVHNHMHNRFCVVPLAGTWIEILV